MPRIQHKRGTSANLASVNPTPLAGELVWDSTENAIKIGDGATAWTSLAYVTATPRSHVHDGADITTGTVAYARLPVGSTTSTVCAGDDARLSDARTPTAHKSTHATGGSDALTPADIGAAPAASPEFTGVIRSFPSGVFSTAYNSFVGDGVYLSSLNTVAGLGTFGAAISWSRLGNNAVRSAAISSVQTGADSDLVGLAFFVHASSSASADIEEAMRIDHGKLVGIGTTSPASRLDVNGVITVSATSGSAGSYLPSLTFSGDSNTGFGQVSGQSDTASIFTAGHERVRVDASGRVGIGATPDTLLHLSTPVETLTTAQKITGTSWGGGEQIDVQFARGTSNIASWICTLSASATTGSLGVATGGTERMRVKDTGAVRFVPLSADPASGEAGDVYYNSSTNKLRVYNGTSWVDLH